MRRRLTTLLAVAALPLAIPATAQDGPTETGRELRDVPQKSRDDLLAMLRALQLAPKTPEEQAQLLDQIKSSPEHRKMIERMLGQARGSGMPGIGALPPGTSQPPTPALPSPRPNPGGEPKASNEQPSGEPPPPPIAQAPPPGGGVDRAGQPNPFRDPRQAGPFPQGGLPQGGAAGDPIENRPDLQKFVGFWEKNVAPLDRTPALKKALLDMVKSADATKLAGGDGADGGLLSFLGEAGAGAGDPGRWDWVEKSFGDSGWKLPELGLKDWSPKLGGSAPNWAGPSGRPSSFGGGFGGPSGDAPWSALFALIGLAAAAYLAWRYWPLVAGGGEKVDLSKQPWPVDPRTVADREALVRAFEFLSIRLCGDAARVWHHRTIAAALRAKVVGADAVADELAGLYELARYTPPDEPLPPPALAAARRGLSHLAGVQPA